MSPERPGRWVTLRRGAGKSWQISQAGGALGRAFRARLGAPSLILRCLLTGSLGSRGGLRGTLAGLVLGSRRSSSGTFPVSLGRLPAVHESTLLDVLSQRRERSAHVGRGPLTPATGPKGLGRGLDIKVGAERPR